MNPSSLQSSYSVPVLSDASLTLQSETEKSTGSVQYRPALHFRRNAKVFLYISLRWKFDLMKLLELLFSNRFLAINFTRRYENSYIVAVAFE